MESALEELTLDSREQTERKEHHDRRDRGRRHRPDDLLDRFAIAASRSGRQMQVPTMFSVITTASSITRPIAIAIAPSVMRLNVCPMSDITNTVIAIVSGIDDALIAVIRAVAQEQQQDEHREHGTDQHRVRAPT
jgi:hypothetical protein